MLWFNRFLYSQILSTTNVVYEPRSKWKKIFEGRWLPCCAKGWFVLPRHLKAKHLRDAKSGILKSALFLKILKLCAILFLLALWCFVDVWHHFAPNVNPEDHLFQHTSALTDEHIMRLSKESVYYLGWQTMPPPPPSKAAWLNWESICCFNEYRVVRLLFFEK